MTRPKPKDTDFNIHVDPSCLSAPMDDESTLSTNKNMGSHPAPSTTDETLVNAGQDQVTNTVGRKNANSQAANADEGVVEIVGDVIGTEPLEDSVHILEASDVSADMKHDLDHDETEGASHLAEEEEEEHDEDLTNDAETSFSRESMDSSDRRVSGRTDALIHAAARAVVDQIERHRREDVLENDSVLSSALNDRGLVDGTECSYLTENTYDEDDDHQTSFASEAQESRRSSDRQSSGTVEVHSETDQDRGGDSSSHHDADSELFSDRSGRSSLGSFGTASDQDKEKTEHPLEDDTLTQCSVRSSRISDAFSQYEPEEFVPTVRGTPRPAFRTPSDVRALQMSSPTPSVYSGASPRSSKRHHLPTISRLGSPSVIQYSPKNRTTPSRLKPRKTTPPLVLLHATMLPLRWAWGDVIENATSDVLSPEMKALRDAWRHLQDRLDDTVCERGILIPHPQNDYEVLEERLLDALDLPLRRRARILECGHYLGPANEMTFAEDLEDESEAEDGFHKFGGSERESGNSQRQSTQSQSHWCTTCHTDIRYESLGPGKVFRVKIYASNGLMKAGAWSACWKEMERVDVEMEPIADARLQEELEILAAAQQQQQDDEEAKEIEVDDMESQRQGSLVGGVHDHDASTSPAGPESISTGRPTASSPLGAQDDDDISRHDQLEERRIRDEARLREIYGESPPAQPTSCPSPTPHPDSSYEQRPTPVSPSEEAFARREARRAQTSLQSASLPELLLEATRVMLQDRKNVALLMLSLLVLFLAVRPATSDPHLGNTWDPAHVDRQAAVPPPMDTTQAFKEAESVISSIEKVVSVAAHSSDSLPDPCQTPSSRPGKADAERGQQVPPANLESTNEDAQKAQPEEEIVYTTVTSKEVVRVVETVTHTETVNAIVAPTEVLDIPQYIIEAETESKGPIDGEFNRPDPFIAISDDDTYKQQEDLAQAAGEREL